jgi:hypothetical protein
VEDDEVQVVGGRCGIVIVEGVVEGRIAFVVVQEHGVEEEKMGKKKEMQKQY